MRVFVPHTHPLPVPLPSLGTQHLIQRDAALVYFSLSVSQHRRTAFPPRMKVALSSSTLATE